LRTILFFAYNFVTHKKPLKEQIKRGRGNWTFPRNLQKGSRDIIGNTMKKNSLFLLRCRLVPMLLCLILSAGCIGILFCTSDTRLECTTILTVEGGEADGAYVPVVRLVDKNNGSNVRYVYPGGIPFGVKIYTEGLIVSGFSDIDVESGSKSPAYDAGLRTGDILKRVNGSPICSVKDLTAAVEACGGKEIIIDYERGSKEYVTSFIPAYSTSECKYKTGMWVKDSTSGIGTVTYVIPETNEFGGLGHGICDGDTGDLVKMTRGVLTDATITGAAKGLPGSPGELKGYFSSVKNGAVVKNTGHGIFGVMTALPSGLPEGLLEIASKKEIVEGVAYIWSTVDDQGPQKFEIEICNIDRGCTDGKCFSVRVTDERLIAATGGIVQGMSGSPIIQNGKIIGAVTHVLINDPTSGYGIFIENMLTTAG